MPETPKTIVIDLKGDEPDQTFTNCTEIVDLDEPCRLRFKGTKGNVTATWTFPCSSFNSYASF